MHVLFDTSALFKRYSGETGAARVRTIQGQSLRVTAAAHCKTEVASALTRQWREGLFSDAEYARVLLEIGNDFEELRVMAIDEQVENFAIGAMRLSPLRAMDALHIGTAQLAMVDLFVTADRRQAAAAQMAGLRTELIEA